MLQPRNTNTFLHGKTALCDGHHSADEAEALISTGSVGLRKESITPIGGAVVGNGYIARQYRTMSSEDRTTFDRWIKANAAAGLLIAAALIAMALAGSMGPSEEIVAKIDAPNVAALQKSP